MPSRIAYHIDITLTLNYGPLDAEFSGEDREELQSELIEFVEFIDEEEALSTLPRPEENSEPKPEDKEGDQAPLSGWGDPDSSPTTQDSGSVRDEFTSLSTITGVDENTLDRLFELPENEEGVPSLNMYHFENGVLRLGDARNQRQAQASSLLMLAWEACLNEKKIKFDRLDDALVASDVETERRGSMGQAFSSDASDWFESDGSQIYLVGKGKNHARKLIQELADEFE
ncbi:hypothetical protein [Halorubrum sp. AJ67]|uniref:hypothetical protein n=1 Tax=Halorubrum sp. AJ67 TaxID=1173487 RepID=UPI0003DC3FC1|nr:hypothetical protein [Halorubrum sp. AJ67]CDK38403.1 hypothetical protein BN903_78 [Halorubrum sp. AJ67]